jgi:L-rhamnose mutarotase
LGGEILYADYSAFLSGMNRSEDVPETYHFDVKIVAELEDDNKRKTEATFYYSKSGDYIGLGQDDNLMVMDSKNDLIVNMAYALPNMMKLGSIYAQQEIKDNAENYTIEKTGKKKKVSGYQTLEYKVYNADEEHKFYMAENFPVSWVDSYSAMMSEMAPSVDMGRWEDVEGMLLKSETKENGKLVSKMETVKVDLKGFTIEKKDYKFGNYQDN